MLNISNPIYTILPLIIGSCLFVLAVIIYKNNPKLVTNKTLSLCCISGTVWFYCYSINYIFPIYPALNLFLFKLGYSFITIIWLSYLHFTMAFLKIKDRKLLLFFYFLAFIIVLFTLATNLIIKGDYNYFWGPYPRAGGLHFIHLLYAGFIWLYCLKNLYKGYRNKENKYSLVEVNKIQYVFWAYFIGNSAAIDYIPNYGVEFYPFGCINVLIFLSILSFAILRHQLLDIKVVIKRTLIFALLFAIVYGLVSALVFGVNMWLVR